MITRLKYPLIVSIFCCLQTACSSSKKTARRIDQNATLFQQKSVEDRQKISRGTITSGMTRDAVFLAWGEPKSRIEGEENGAPYEEWVYKKFEPKLDLGISLGEGPGFNLKRETNKVVRFVDGRVASFHSVQ